MLLPELKDRARESLLTYSQLFDKRYQPSETGLHDFFAHHLERAERGETKFLILTVPPRHGKSRQVAVEFATWYLGRHPDRHVAVASYASHLSERHSRDARERVRDPRFREVFGTCLSDYRESASEWILDQKGSYRAVGIGGSLTGFGAHCLIIDDPVKDHEEAHSDKQRDVVWNWFVSVGLLRLEEPSLVVIIMTRWHPDDLVGRLLDPKRKADLAAQGVDLKIEHYNIPAISKGEKVDLLERPQGAPLFPERQPLETVKARMALSGTYVSSALFDGEPVPLGGHMIDPRHFKIVDEIPDEETLRWIWSWDLAATAKQQSKSGDPDHTVGAKIAVDRKGNLWIARMVRGQWAWPQSRTRIATIAASEGLPVLVEDVAGFKTAVDNLREVMPKNVLVRTVTVDTDKVSRALPWIALAEAGKVYLVRGDWVEDFKKECLQFPVGHDDQIDAVSNGYAGAASHTTGRFHEVESFRRRTIADYGQRALY